MRCRFDAKMTWKPNINDAVLPYAPLADFAMMGLQPKRSNILRGRREKRRRTQPCEENVAQYAKYPCKTSLAATIL